MALKITKKDKEWFAERCGELFVKILPKNISHVNGAALERHGLERTPKNRHKILQAYRTANPRIKASYAANTYDPFYDAGSESFSASSAEIQQFLVASGIDKEHSLQQVRAAIIATIREDGISALDAKFLDVFKYGVNLNELREIGQKTTSRYSDEDGEDDEFDAAIDSVGSNVNVDST